MQGHFAEHVSDMGMSAVPDNVIWDYALEHTAIIVTKDEDFAQRKVLARRKPRRALASHSKHEETGVADSIC
jgi:predicted nuclease of predicted toxin-antitoxin system